MTGATDIPALPARDPRGHKGTFGTVAVFGGRCAGGQRMIGAPCLTALAALRAGAGLAKLALPEPIINAALVITPSATGTPLPVDSAGEIAPSEAARILSEASESSNALVVGPGLGVSAQTRALALQAVVQEECPVVLDADAINALAQHPELQRDVRASVVLTPHPGEFARLASALGLDGAPSAENAQRLGAFLGVIVVLKGATTVVADAVNVWEHAGDLPQLATGGTGDVLAGTIAGLIAQHAKEIGLFACACHGVAAHAEAAREWGEAYTATGGMLAAELLDALPGAIEARRDR